MRLPDYEHVLYQGPPDLCYSEYESRIISLKSYEITDHLSNPRVIFNDNRLENYVFNKLATPPNISHTGSLLALDPIEMNNYYPFGMLKSGMTASTGETYRYGFNTYEKDDEIKGLGNNIDFGARMYDPRIGRFKSLDPMGRLYPGRSHYLFAGNSPIRFIDMLGLSDADATSKYWYYTIQNVPYTDTGLDYLIAVENGLRNLVNHSVLGMWNSGVANYQSLSEGGVSGWVSDLGDEAVEIGIGIKNYATVEYNYVVNTPFNKQVDDTWNGLVSTFTTPQGVEGLTELGAGMLVAGFSYRIINGLKTFRPRTLGSKNILDGQFKIVNESMSDAAKSYQTHVTGKAWNESYVLNGTKFDGYSNGILLEAKSGHLNFVNPKTGEFHRWFKGKEDIISQAKRQKDAASGNRIRWTFENEEVMNATKNLFEARGIDGIELMHVPRTIGK